MKPTFGKEWSLGREVRRFGRHALTVFSMLSLLLMVGCAGTTTFTAYPKKINPYIASIQTRTPIDFTQCLISECGSKDLILYNMERGRVAHVTGFLDYSLRDFNVSMDQIKQNEEKARVSASTIGANLALRAGHGSPLPGTQLHEETGHRRCRGRGPQG
jgi:hypothetical protein